MKCLILAAGYATRLYPLTENFPKPLLEVKGKTILDWLVDDIDASGAIDEYVIETRNSDSEDWKTVHTGTLAMYDEFDDVLSTGAQANQYDAFYSDDTIIADMGILLSGNSSAECKCKRYSFQNRIFPQINQRYTD